MESTTTARDRVKEAHSSHGAMAAAAAGAASDLRATQQVALVGPPPPTGAQLQSAQLPSTGTRQESAWAPPQTSRSSPTVPPTVTRSNMLPAVQPTADHEPPSNRTPHRFTVTLSKIARNKLGISTATRGAACLAL